MSDFDDLEKKARAYAEEHPDQADQGVDQAPEFAERATDLQHDEQVDRAVDTAGQHTGPDREDRQD
jgi:hypothetical protein